MLILWYEILIQDIKNAAFEITLQQLIRPGFFLLWLAILAMPLRGIDRRDFVAGLMFILVAVATGVAMIFALPQGLIPDLEGRTVLIAMFCMGVAASARWFLSREFFVEKEKKTNV